MAVITLVVMTVTFYWFPEYSVLGFVMIALFALEFARDRFERLFDSGINVDEELAKGNNAVAINSAGRWIAYALVIAAALLGVPKAIGEPQHIRVAMQYVGLVEEPGNRGKIIDSWNRQAKAPLGSPYCASFVGHCLTKACALLPKYRGAYSRAYINKTSITLPLRKSIDLTGYLLVFKRNGGGHIAIITRKVYGNKWRAIEANTSPEGYTGSQWNGGGVYMRTRDLRVLSSPYNSFRATHVTSVKYS